MTHRPTTADVIAWLKDEKAKREAAEQRAADAEATGQKLRDHNSNLVVELEVLRHVRAQEEATGRAAVRALAAIRSRSVWGVHTNPATSCCWCALDHEIDAVLATDTARAWLSEEGE